MPDKNISIPTLTVVHQPSYSGYRMALGRTSSGKRKYWYLGEDQTAAQATAERLTRQWQDILQSGGDCWPQENKNRIHPRPVQVAVDGLHAMLVRFQTAAIDRPISQAQKSTLRWRCEKLRRILPDTACSSTDQIVKLLSILSGQPVSVAKFKMVRIRLLVSPNKTLDFWHTFRDRKVA